MHLALNTNETMPYACSLKTFPNLLIQTFGGSMEGTGSFPLTPVLVQYSKAHAHYSQDSGECSRGGSLVPGSAAIPIIRL